MIDNTRAGTDPPLTPNPEIRITAFVLLALTPLGYLGAITGWDTPQLDNRIAVAGASTLMLVIGLLLLRSRLPAVEGIQANVHGIAVMISGAASEFIAWTLIREVRMRILIGLTCAQFRGLDGTLVRATGLDPERLIRVSVANLS